MSSWCNSPFSSNHPCAIHPFLHVILVQFTLFFKSSLCNSSFSSCNPGAIHLFLHIILVQFILFFISSRCNSSFSSYHPGAIHHFLHIILVQFILFFISSWCKTTSATRNWINSVPQGVTTTFDTVPIAHNDQQLLRSVGGGAECGDLYAGSAPARANRPPPGCPPQEDLRLRGGSGGRGEAPTEPEIQNRGQHRHGRG